MGIMSRRVLPACGNLCICCPELRARSRQPVKRYKKLLSDIFPKSQRVPKLFRWFTCVHYGVRELQEEPPNDRKIGKLAEYASKNPLRIPKIATGLEQRGYKALRNERYGTVRVVMRAYSKLLSSCRDQMPLFATSSLSMIRVLLEQGRNESMQVLACLTLIDFLNNQTDSTYMRDLDELLPKLTGLCRETGEDRRRVPLRASGLQALASMISFMGKYSHIPAEFDDIVTVVLDNYEAPLLDEDAETHDRAETHHNWVKQVLKGEGRGPVAVMRGAFSKLQSHKESSQLQDPVNISRIEIEIPKVWAQICVQNMARLAKEATTVRRVLEPMFRYFDAGKHWPPEKGLALAVLRDMQHFMEKSGNDQLSLPILVRHLDHKNVVNNIQLKISIVEVTANLARLSKAKATGADIGAMSDLLRHLRRSFQFSLEASKTAKVETLNSHIALQHILEECLIELSRRVGDVAPLFAMIATTLERLSIKPNVARATTEAVFVLAHSMAYVPDQSYAEEVFPQAALLEVLKAMIHSDVETRVKAHHIFALLLVPPSLTSRSDDLVSTQNWPETSSTLSRSTSAFGSAAALFEKLRREKSGTSDRDVCFETTRNENTRENVESIELTEIGAARNKETVGPYSLSPNRHYGFKLSKERTRELSMDRSLAQLRRPANNGRDLELNVVRLSGYQAGLLLSTLWLQATFPDNVPSSYEAIANTYILTLIFSRAKTSSHKTVIKAFQLALSLRSLAVDPSYAAIQLPPSRRRSLFTLATAMLVFAGKAYRVPQLGAVAKASLTSTTMDPYLELLDDVRLKVVNSPAGYVNVKDYGSAADDRDALKSFAGISISEEQTAEALAALIVGSSTVLEPDDFAVADQMLQPFSVVEGYELGPHSYFETPCSRESPPSRNSLSFEEVLPHTNGTMEDDLISETSGVELPRLLANVSVPLLTSHVIGVTQLLEAALLTAGQVASTTVADTPLSYSAMVSQCETFAADSRKKISSALKLDVEHHSLLLTFPQDDMLSTKPIEDEQQVQEVFRLPPASPYDNFLKAAGC